MHEASVHAEFAATYNRKTMRNMAGDVHARAHLFSHWDEVLPNRRLEAAATPYEFNDRSGPLEGAYEYAGETYSIDDYVLGTGLDIYGEDALQALHPGHRCERLVRSLFDGIAPRHDVLAAWGSDSVWEICGDLLYGYAL